MPRGKELEQLPMGNIAPGAGKDKGQFKRDSLESLNHGTQPHPSSIKDGRENKA
ncbi:hypothetical protein [Neobacillus piezotolerans]|uniref:hypothetical protein n=1 Tax=Neobacillus piezotolerans TaxID=2259171 RepID=UPI0015F14153|nr:hypothetical protein [Neobacillus piezotolerans]